MAFVKITGFSAEIEALKRAGNDTGELVKDMLLAGGDTAKKIWKDVITERGHVDTGDMRDSVGAKFISYRNGSAEVYPLEKSSTPSKRHGGGGKKRKPIRNAEKAFILHYGRSNLLGDLFVDEIEDRIIDKGFDAMNEVYEKFLEKENL